MAIGYSCSLNKFKRANIACDSGILIFDVCSLAANFQYEPFNLSRALFQGDESYFVLVESAYSLDAIQNIRRSKMMGQWNARASLTVILWCFHGKSKQPLKCETFSFIEWQRLDFRHAYPSAP